LCLVLCQKAELWRMTASLLCIWAKGQTTTQMVLPLHVKTLVILTIKMNPEYFCLKVIWTNKNTTKSHYTALLGTLTFQLIL
jgi:hypothetical protein